MEEEFTTFATASVMVDNISYAQADTLAEQLRQISAAKLTPTQLKGRVEDLESASEAASLLAPLQVHVRGF